MAPALLPVTEADDTTTHKGADMATENPASIQAEPRDDPEEMNDPRPERQGGITDPDTANDAGIGKDEDDDDFDDTDEEEEEGDADEEEI
jgi:hypothetical protein